QFLYLSAYPFGNTRDAGEMPGYTVYRVPAGYVPNPALQRGFMQVLLRRVEQAGTPVEVSENRSYPEQAQMWLALTRLEKQVETELPDLFDATVRAKAKLFSLLSRPWQETVAGNIEADNKPESSFDAQVETAEKFADVGRREQMLVSAVTGRSSDDQPTDKVLGVIDKISDANVRAPLLNWFYYFRAQSMLKAKNLSEARAYAAKVTELDQRAYLFTRIAEESLKTNEDQTEARDLLNEISNVVSKAPKT